MMVRVVRQVRQFSTHLRKTAKYLIYIDMGIYYKCMEFCLTTLTTLTARARLFAGDLVPMPPFAIGPETGGVTFAFALNSWGAAQ